MPIEAYHCRCPPPVACLHCSCMSIKAGYVVCYPGRTDKVAASQERRQEQANVLGGKHAFWRDSGPHAIFGVVGVGADCADAVAVGSVKYMADGGAKRLD